MRLNHGYTIWQDRDMEFERMTLSSVPLLTVLLALFAYWQMPQVDGFDYFKLVQQWPVPSCNTGKFSCPTPIKRDFTIHGLWPASSCGLDPTQCKPSVITKQQVPYTLLQQNYISTFSYFNSHVQFPITTYICYNTAWTPRTQSGGQLATTCRPN